MRFKRRALAYIQFLNSGQHSFCYLREYHTFGRRAESVDTLLEHTFVSKLHSFIEWKNPHWLINDVSKNGVWLNSKQITPYTATQLKKGDVVEIAGRAETAFKICDLSEPHNMIYRADRNAIATSLENNTLIPSEIAPEYALYKCPDRMQWFSEEIVQSEDESIDEHAPYEHGPYQHGDSIQCRSGEWILFLVSETDATTEFWAQQRNLNDVEFRCDLSQDEENTMLTLIDGKNEIELGSRSHHYLLAHLLRFKHAQQTSAEDPAAGWMDCKLLTKELGIDEAYMNIQIFRARKQVADALPLLRGHSTLIERRRGSVRVGLSNYSIYKEGAREV